MNNMRAITILFSGGEISQKGLNNIYSILRNDDKSNATNISIAAYTPAEVATIVTANTVKIGAKAEGEPAEERPTLDVALHILHSSYGSSCERLKNVPVIGMAFDYTNNNNIKYAFDEVDAVSDSELSCYKPYLDSKISREFIHAIREIVKNAKNYVPR